MIIKRKYYSNPTLEQKEYGLKSAIKSGLKNVKKFRKNLKNIDERIEKSVNDIRRSDSELRAAERKIDKNNKVGRKLAKDAYKNNIRVFDKNEYLRSSDNFNYWNAQDISVKIDKKMRKVAKEELKNPNLNRLQKKVFRSMKNKDTKGIINIDGKFDNRPDVLAHEIGHFLNEKGSIKNRAIRKLHRFAKNNLNKIENRSEKGKSRFYDGTLRTINTGAEKFLQPMEERNAWNNAIKLLKKNGANEEEITKAKNVADIAVKRYQSIADKDFYESLKKNKEMFKLKRKTK